MAVTHRMNWISRGHQGSPPYVRNTQNELNQQGSSGVTTLCEEHTEWTESAGVIRGHHLMWGTHRMNWISRGHQGSPPYVRNTQNELNQQGSSGVTTLCEEHTEWTESAGVIRGHHLMSGTHSISWINRGHQGSPPNIRNTQNKLNHLGSSGVIWGHQGSRLMSETHSISWITRGQQGSSGVITQCQEHTGWAVIYE